MQMKKLILLMVAAAGSGSGFAADFIDTARVVSSSPVYERVADPRQECWIETVSSTGTVTRSAPQEHNIGGALLGGVVGGVVGNQIGQGNGNAVATAAGAIAGALIGDQVANQDQNGQPQQVTQAPQVRQEQHCRTIENYKDVIRGYDVTYRYSGKDVTVRLPNDPGDTVRVGVSVLRDR
jgi:uncharacterized protein YcfJ